LHRARIVDIPRPFLDPHRDLDVFRGLERMLNQKGGVALLARLDGLPQVADRCFNDRHRSPVFVQFGVAQAVDTRGLYRTRRATPERIGPDHLLKGQLTHVADLLRKVVPDIRQERTEGNVIGLLPFQGGDDSFS
jgi:hypothetical protein